MAMINDKLRPINISVILVNWNTKEMLSDCINSIYAKTATCNLEIIVVDNGSTDGTIEFVQNNYPNVKMICNQENLGFAKANNIGITVAEGKFVCLVNTDILLIDYCFDEMFSYMERNPEIGLLGPRTVNKELNFRQNCRELPSLRNIITESFLLHKIFPKVNCLRGRSIKNFRDDKIQEVEVLSGCFLMARKAAIDHIGLLDEKFFFYGEDKDWCKRFSEAGWKTVFYPKVTAIHYGGASSSKNPIKYEIERLKSEFIYWDKHNKLLEKYVILLVMYLHHSVRASGYIMLYAIDSKKRKYLSEKIQGNIACLKWLTMSRLLKQN